jgi:hypothetical protein
MPPDNSILTWDPASTDALRIIEDTIKPKAFWEKLGQLYSQESSRGSSSIELRDDNIDFIKTLFKVSRYLNLVEIILTFAANPDVW